MILVLVTGSPLASILRPTARPMNDAAVHDMTIAELLVFSCIANSRQKEERAQQLADGALQLSSLE